MGDQKAASEKHSAQFVGNVFVKQYYQFLKDHPEHVHKFYSDSSVVNWSSPDGSMKSAITIKEINELIMSSKHRDYTLEIATADAQDILKQEVLVVVTGFYISKQNLTTKCFAQTFVLARQDKGAIFVVNDILRFIDVHDSTSTTTTLPPIRNTRDKPSILPPTHDSGCSDALDDNPPTQNSISKESEPVQVVPATADESKTQSVVVNINEVVTKPPLPQSQHKERISYASMLMKESPISSPRQGTQTHKIVRVSPNANQQTAPSTANKPQVQAATSNNNGVSNVSSPRNVDINEPAKGLYLRGLPYDVTKNAVFEVIKKFGRVKFDDIQFIRYEDGFCCGFVEFYTADSARRAVEAGILEIGGKEVEISYKKRSGSRGNNGWGRHASGRGEDRNGNFNGRQDGEGYKNQYRRQNDNNAGESQGYGQRGQGWFSGRNGKAAPANRRNNQKG